MTKGELMKMLVKYAKGYAPDCLESIKHNSHMNEYRGKVITQNIIDAIIVDFVNFIGYEQGLDLGLYTRDLK